jgi:DUF1365 family protein
MWLRDSAEKGSRKNRKGFILENSVSHSRFLPKPGHTFTYPTLSVLVSINALEQHALDLSRGWLFGYGGIWGRLTGIRPQPYLTASRSSTIREKLEGVLLLHRHQDELKDAWMMTMPSYLAFEGINPLTVYFCYNTINSSMLWLVVLEVLEHSIINIAVLNSFVSGS